MEYQFSNPKNRAFFYYSTVFCVHIKKSDSEIKNIS
jgi:hypothetical protein